ncbi:replication protein A 70 kDa DNA-binding subunit C-like protein [Tanacetum coccineum]
MSTKAIVGKSDAQNNKHVSGEAAGSKHPTSHAEISGTKPDLFLDQLRVDVTGTIIVMIGRVWDVSAVSGRYLSTDFVVSDAKGQMIHCSARASVAHNFLRLKEGGIYSVTNFAVKPNKEEYRVIKDDSFMLEFDGSTTFKRVSVKADGFVRYPLNLVDFDAIEPADNKYLIDVAGYVSNVGRTNHLKSGSKNLDFHLANHRTVNQSYAMGKPRGDKVYLSSTSSTVILDDAEIPAIKALKDANRRVNFPMLRYRLELDVSDVTAQTVVVLFDEPTTALVGCSAGSLMDTEDESTDDHVGLSPAISNLIGTTHVMEIKSQSYYEYGTFESFTCCQLNPEEVCGDSVGSSTLDALDGVQTHRLSRPVCAPTVATPTKPSEPKRTKSLVIKDYDVEVSGDSSRVVAEVSSEDVSGLHTRMHPRNSASYDGMQDTMLPTNNGSTEDIQPPVVQVQSQNPTSEPVVDPVSAPMPNQRTSIPDFVAMMNQRRCISISTEDANQKFLRSLPSAWSQVFLIMRTMPGVNSLSFDDLYNNLKVFESDVKSSTTSSSSTQNVAFVSENTSSTNKVSTAYGASSSSGHIPQREGSSSYTDELINGFEMAGGHDFHEIEEVLQKDRRSGKYEEPKALVTPKGDGVDCTSQSKDEQENYALMAYSNSGSDTELVKGLFL